MSNEAFVYDAVRTPRGRGKANGALHGTKPIDLVVGLIDALRSRNPGLDPGHRRHRARRRHPDRGPGRGHRPDRGAGRRTAGHRRRRAAEPLLRLRPRSRQHGRPKVRSGWEDLVVAGGVESMSRVPMGSDGGAWADPMTNYDTGFVPQGIGADLIATIEGFSRRDVDEFAALSQERAAAAWKDGRFKRSVVPVRDRNGLAVLDHDEHIRPGTTADSLAALKPSFAVIGEQGGFDAVALQKYHWVEQIDHVHHAGNSSGIVDGAALVAIGSRRSASARASRPRARIVVGRGLRLRADHHAHRPRARHPQGARQGRTDDRRHRPGRDQRGVRRRRAALHPRPGPPRTRSTSTVARSPWATRSARPAR